MMLYILRKTPSSQRALDREEMAKLGRSVPEYILQETLLMLLKINGKWKIK